MRPRPSGPSCGHRIGNGRSERLGNHTDMHAFITGHLADARLADIERELAHVELLAALRADADTRAHRSPRAIGVAMIRRLGRHSTVDRAAGARPGFVARL